MDGPGFARAIANTITELRLEQLEPDALTSLAPDVCALLQAYERELKDHGFADWPGVLQLAAAAAADDENRYHLLGLPTLLIDVPVRTASDIAIVRALSSRSSEILITAPANDATTLARLQTTLGIEIVDLDSRAASKAPRDLQEGGSLGRVQCHLFNNGGPSLKAQLDDQVAIFSAPGESRECVEIVRRVLTLARDGVALDRIAVLRSASNKCDELSPPHVLPTSRRLYPTSENCVVHHNKILGPMSQMGHSLPMRLVPRFARCPQFPESRHHALQELISSLMQVPANFRQ